MYIKIRNTESGETVMINNLSKLDNISNGKVRFFSFQILSITKQNIPASIAVE